MTTVKREKKIIKTSTFYWEEKAAAGTGEQHTYYILHYIYYTVIKISHTLSQTGLFTYSLLL